MIGMAAINRETSADTFLLQYHLKEELQQFCRENGMSASGSKQELTDRIAHFLRTGEKKNPAPKPKRQRKAPAVITPDSLIEPDLVCSETHRAFFKAQIGSSFSFNTAFQKWLRSNTGKTYRDAVAAYHAIIAEKKQHRSGIGRQFEYNTYIRDFFADNPGRTLQDAICCWNYRKQQPGSHRYERTDLKALKPE